MQNKGFVRVFAILLTLVCVFYLSFSFVTRHYTSKAKEFAKGDVKVEQDYLDSLANEKVVFRQLGTAETMYVKMNHVRFGLERVV